MLVLCLTRQSPTDESDSWEEWAWGPLPGELKHTYHFLRWLAWVPLHGVYPLVHYLDEGLWPILAQWPIYVLWDWGNWEERDHKGHDLEDQFIWVLWWLLSWSDLLSIPENETLKQLLLWLSFLMVCIDLILTDGKMIVFWYPEQLLLLLLTFWLQGLLLMLSWPCLLSMTKTQWMKSRGHLRSWDEVLQVKVLRLTLMKMMIITHHRGFTHSVLLINAVIRSGLMRLQDQVGKDLSSPSQICYAVADQQSFPQRVFLLMHNAASRAGLENWCLTLESSVLAAGTLLNSKHFAAVLSLPFCPFQPFSSQTYRFFLSAENRAVPVRFNTV